MAEESKTSMPSASPVPEPGKEGFRRKSKKSIVPFIAGMFLLVVFPVIVYVVSQEGNITRIVQFAHDEETCTNRCLDDVCIQRPYPSCRCVCNTGETDGTPTATPKPKNPRGLPYCDTYCTGNGYLKGDCLAEGDRCSGIKVGSDIARCGTVDKRCCCTGNPTPLATVTITPTSAVTATPTGTGCSRTADINGDGSVNALDYQILLDNYLK
jgi:hypothetical protein